MPQTLGQVLAKARSQAGLSLRDVERETGIHNAHLSQIETGAISSPAVGILWQLANLYDLDFGKLMQLAGRAGRSGSSSRSRSLVGAALHSIGDLTPDEEKELLIFLDSLRRRRDDSDVEAVDGH